MLTAGAWHGGDKPWEPKESPEPGRGDKLGTPRRPDDDLAVLHRFIAVAERSDRLRTRLADAGVDIDAVRSALEEPAPAAAAAPDEIDNLRVQLSTNAEATALPLTTPVQRVPKRPGRPGSMFERPNQDLTPVEPEHHDDDDHGEGNHH